MFWKEVHIKRPKIDHNDIDFMRQYGSVHSVIPDDIFIIPLTTTPGKIRKVEDKTDATETEPFGWVPIHIIDFINSFTVKTWYWTITILKPGGNLPIHMDTVIGKGTHEMTRMHWPIETNIQCEMIWYADDRETVLENKHLSEGCYVVDVSTPHTITNNSNEERIHLLCNIDIPYQDFIKEDHEIFNARK